MKFFIKDFFSKCDQIRRKLRIWPHLQKKSLIENFIFCAVIFVINFFAIWFLVNLFLYINMYEATSFAEHAKIRIRNSDCLAFLKSLWREMEAFTGGKKF